MRIMMEHIQMISQVILNYLQAYFSSFTTREVNHNTVSVSEVRGLKMPAFTVINHDFERSSPQITFMIS